uniref:PiggyBac transposable element-derived protein domain-containing protein n=1 Tax=Timema bartmani TaxID=61472 RepID=A0A7R9FDS6_9NEOP|nr:unnamed protein product [Timema bartmani]
MYWETSSDTHNEAVSKAMSRNTFEDSLKSLHVCDNLTLDENDKFGKATTALALLNRIEKASLEEASRLLRRKNIRVSPGPSPKRLKKRVCDDIRLDGLDHVIVKSMTQIRCA